MAMFGSENFQNVAGVIGGATGDVPRTSLAAWTFYAEHLSQIIGVPLLVLGAIGMVFLVVGGRTEQWMAWLLVSWFVIGYVSISLINHREPRFSIPILFPAVAGAVLLLQWNGSRVFSQAVSLALAAGYVVYVVAFEPTAGVKGFAELGDYIASQAPKDGVVLFDATNDGSFVFDMREHEERRDIMTIRANKLFLTWGVARDRGVVQKDYDEQKITETLQKLGVDYILYQPGFWEDLKEMQQLSAVVHSENFRKVATFPITDTLDHSQLLIEVYKPTYQVTHSGFTVQYDLPTAGGRKIQGAIR
jgi:hypothetical protein